MKKIFTIVFLLLFSGIFYTTAQAIDFIPRASCADQGASSVGCAKSLITAIGSKQARLLFKHSSNSASTTYTFTTSTAIPSNVTIEVEPGAILAGTVTGLTRVKARWFGATQNKTTIDAALTFLGTTTKAALEFDEAWTIAASANWSTYTNVTFRANPGTLFTHTSYTLNIPNPDAGLYQWLSGSGAVTFSGGSIAAYPHWFGADPGGTTDSITPILAAVNSSASIVDGANGLFKITTSIVMVSNQTIQNMRVYDSNYRTTSQHTFFTAIGTIGANIVNASLKNIQVLGNNTSYALLTDSWSYNGYGVIDGIGIFYRYTTGGTVSGVICNYMESCMQTQFATALNIDNLQSTQAEAETHSGLTLGASYDTIARNVRIYNGGDGALSIYNGSNCHILDSLVKNTTPATYNLAGAGIESAINCSMRNVKAEGSWVGFALVESALGVSVIDSTADGCHVGFLIGPFGIGAKGSDIHIKGNRVVHMTDDGATTYPVSGVLIYNNNASYATPHSVYILDNYIGRSNAGVGIYVDVPATKEIQKLRIKGNNIEASTLESFNWETQSSSSWNTQARAMYLKNVWYSDVSDNYIVDAANPGVLTESIYFVGAKAVKFNGNSMQQGVSTYMVHSDSTSTEIGVVGNKMAFIPGGGLQAFYMEGTSHTFHANSGWGDTFNVAGSLNFGVTTYLYNGISHFYTEGSGQVASLVEAVPKATGSGGGIEPLKITFTAAAADLTIHPTATDTIRGLAMGADYTLSAGTTRTFVCFIENYWEVW